MESDLCHICGIELGGYQQKHYCQDCKHVLCSGCQSLKMKLFYMTNDIRGITPGYCFTCKTLKDCRSPEKDKQRISDVSSDFTNDLTAGTLELNDKFTLVQGGTKESKGDNSEYTEDQGSYLESTGRNLENIENEAGSCMQKGDSKESNGNVADFGSNSLNTMKETTENTVYQPGYGPNCFADSKGDNKEIETNLMSNATDSRGKNSCTQSADFGNHDVDSKGNNNKCKSNFRTEDTNSKGNNQRHADHVTGYTGSIVNLKANKKKNTAIGEGERYFGNSKMKGNKLNEEKNENKDQGEFLTESDTNIASKTESKHHIVEVTKTERKKQKKEDEKEQTKMNEAKGDNSIKTGESKEVQEEHQREKPNTETASAGAVGEKTSEIKENKASELLKKKSSKLQRLREGTFQHTCAGCGRKDCEGNFMKLLREMISTAKASKFDIHNVTPDGNCMFAAVVDQLELQNDRSFSPRRLRQACVDFLRDNPESYDGTPYVLFLDNESWEDYLSRMSQEGQWGDHMMLQAIAQVTGRSIQVIHNDRQRDWTRIETQIPGENHMYPITLGHVGEFHYVSLRPSDSVKKTQEENIEDEDFQSMDNFSLSIPSLHDARREMFEEDYVDSFCEVPALHLSYLIKKLFPQSVIKMADNMMETAISMELQQQEIMEPIFQKAHDSTAYSSSKHNFSVKAYGEVVEGLWVPYITERERTQFDKGSEWADVKMMQILGNCSAYAKDHKDLTKMDVIIEPEHVHPGYTRLLAHYPDMWGLSDNPDESAMTYYVPNKHALFESYGRDRGEKDSYASQNPLVVSLFCDYTNALACPIWPKEAAEWKTRVRPADWPPSDVIDTIVQDGCHLEGKPHVNSTNPDIEFRFCFGMAERYLATHILSKNQRLCFLLFKSLCSQEFCGESLISADHLMSIFFYACEQLRKESWSTKLGSCLFFLLDCLMTSVQERNISNYFIPANNMLDHLTDSQFEQIGQHIFALRSQPFTHLVTIAHQNGILDAIDILSKVQLDFSDFKEHRNVRQSVISVLVPTTLEKAQEYIHDKFYKKALETVQEAFEERLSVSTCEDQLPFAAFVSEVINRYPLTNQWWFLFSADETLGTTLCADLTLPLSPVTMEEIFPEKISKNYKGVLIPFSMTENLCTFCFDFASYLINKHRTYQAFDVIEHALEKYNSLQAQVDPVNPTQYQSFGDFTDVNIFNIYTKYVYICEKLDRLALISEKMAEIERICERINSVNSYTCLTVFWSVLGDEAKSKAAALKARSLKQTTSA